MSRKKYNAERARASGEMTRDGLMMGAISIVDRLNKEGLVKRTARRKTYWVDSHIAERLQLELATDDNQAPTDTQNENGMRRVAVGVLLGRIAEIEPSFRASKTLGGVGQVVAELRKPIEEECPVDFRLPVSDV